MKRMGGVGFLVMFLSAGPGALQGQETVIRPMRLPGMAARGLIRLQHHGDPVQFANIYIKELE